MRLTSFYANSLQYNLLNISLRTGSLFGEKNSSPLDQRPVHRLLNINSTYISATSFPGFSPTRCHSVLGSLSISPFFASIFPLFPQKRLILRLRFGHPRVLGIPIPISLAFWASPVGDAQNADRFDFA